MPDIRRPRLSRPLVVDAGLRLVRAEGPASVTMRRVAEDLDVAAMSLYRHVEDRQGLLVAMLDRVAQEIEAPAPLPHPRDDLLAVLTAIHAALRRDPWVVGLLVADGLAGPSILPLMERTHAALAALGLDHAATRRVHGALLQYTYGEVLSVHHARTDSVARRLASEAERAGDLPHLTAAARAAAAADARAASEGTVRDDYPHVLARLLDALLGRPPLDGPPD